MPMTVLEQHYRDRMQSLRQIAMRSEQQMATHEAGHLAAAEFFVQDLVALCSDLSDSGRQLLEQEFKRIFKAPDLSVRMLRERRRVIEELSASFIELATRLKNLASQAYQTAGRPPGTELLSRFDEAAGRLVAAKTSVLERWPVGSDEEIAEARKGGRPEDYLDADEAFAQIAGVDVETWRRRMDKYKGPQSE